MKRKLTFVQSIMLFVLISVIPLYLLFILVYQTAYRTIRDDLMASIARDVEQVMADMDAELMNLAVRQSECLNLLCTRRITLEDSLIYTNYEIISAKRELAEIMKVVQLNSRLLSASDIYFPRTGSMYTNETGWGNMDEENRAYVEGLLQCPEGQLTAYRDGYLFYQTNRQPLSLSDSPADAVIAMQISADRVKSLFSARQKSELYNFFLVDESDGGIIAGTEDIAPGALTSLLQDTQHEGGFRMATHEGGRYYLLRSESASQALSLYCLVGTEAITASLRHFTLYLVLSLVLLGIILTLLILQSYYLLYRPVYRLLRGFERLQTGDLSVRLGRSFTREFDTLNDGFNETAHSLSELIDQRYRLRILAKEAELRHLYTQINPHFLYNCFFTVESMLEEENYDLCRDMAHLLGTYLQYLSAGQQATATIEEEVRHAAAYAEIQTVRFGNRVTFELEPLPEAWRYVEVPRVILQPLLENAFEHGVKQGPGKGWIALRFEEARGKLIVSVEDGGKPLSSEQLAAIRRHAQDEPEGTRGVALHNISTRLQLMKVDAAGLQFSPSREGGLRVSFTLENTHREVPE